MFAAVGAAELAHQRAGFFGDGAHLGGTAAGAGDAHVENRPHVQRAHRGMGIPGAACAVAGEHVGERVGVLGQVVERHRAVFDEAHRLAVALQAHHDVQAGLANLPEVLLRRLVDQAHHAAGQAEVAHQRHQLIELGRQFAFRFTAELDQQNRRRPADQRRFNRRAKRRVRQAQVDHGAIDQFHGGGCELDDVLGRFHRGAKGREVDDAQGLRARKFGKLQGQAAREGERAFRADQQMCEVHVPVARVGQFALRVEDVEVVATDPAQHLGPAGFDLAVLLVGQVAHELAELGRPAAELRQRAEVQQFPAGQPGARTGHVVHHVAVGDRAAAARVVAGHAAQRGLRAGGHVHRVPQAVGLELRVQVVEHQAGLHNGLAVRRVDMQARAGSVCWCRSPARRRWSGRTGWCRRHAPAPAP